MNMRAASSLYLSVPAFLSCHADTLRYGHVTATTSASRVLLVTQTNSIALSNQDNLDEHLTATTIAPHTQIHISCRPPIYTTTHTLLHPCQLSHSVCLATAFCGSFCVEMEKARACVCAYA